MYVYVYCIGLLAGETQRSTLSENLGQSVLSALVEYLCVLRTEVVEPSCEKHGEKEKQELPYLCLRKEEHDDVMGGKNWSSHSLCVPSCISFALACFWRWCAEYASPYPEAGHS